MPITTPQQNFTNATRFLKFEYDNALSSTTYMALRYYNWGDIQATDGSYSQGPWFTGFPGVGQVWNGIGGNTSGVNLDLLHQFGSNLTVTLNGQYNVVRPIWNDYSPGLQLLAPLITGLARSVQHCGLVAGRLRLQLLRQQRRRRYRRKIARRWRCRPVSNRTACRVSRIGAINYNETEFQEYGDGIRFQYNPSSRIRFDLGVREEGQNQHWYSQIGNLGQGAPATGTCVGTCAAYGVAAGSRSQSTTRSTYAIRPGRTTCCTRP